MSKEKTTIHKVYRKAIFHVIKWELIILSLLLLGKNSYERAYEDTSKRLDEKQAKRDYNRILHYLEELDLEGTEDLSKKIYNITSIDIREDEFYQAINETLQTLQTKSEVEAFAWEYLPEYISRNNNRIDEMKLSFKEGTVQYKNENMELDADCMEVLGSLLESMEDASKSMTKQEEAIWKEQVIKQIIATELYDIEICTPKRLKLSPSVK